MPPLITQREMDSPLDSVRYRKTMRMARYAHQLTGEKYLCLAGGVALNCVATDAFCAKGHLKISGFSRRQAMPEEPWVQLLMRIIPTLRDPATSLQRLRHPRILLGPSF